MPIIGFTVCLAALEAHTKCQTIRRSIKGKVGDTLYLYWKLRTKECMKLGEGKLTEIYQLVIQKEVGPYWRKPPVYAPLNTKEMEDLAIADGFSSWDELKKTLMDLNGWTEKDLPQTVYVHKWAWIKIGDK